jgi:hypothetical protein
LILWVADFNGCPQKPFSFADELFCIYYSGIKYVWCSSLADVEKISGGKLHVPHFTDKKRIEEKLQQAGFKVIAVGPAFYYSNWSTLFSPKAVGNNVYEFTLPLKPDTLLSAFAVEDTGLIVGATLKNPDEFVGKCTQSS